MLSTTPLATMGLMTSWVPSPEESKRKCSAACDVPDIAKPWPPVIGVLTSNVSLPKTEAWDGAIFTVDALWLITCVSQVLERSVTLTSAIDRNGAGSTTRDQCQRRRDRVHERTRAVWPSADTSCEVGTETLPASTPRSSKQARTLLQPINQAGFRPFQRHDLLWPLSAPPCSRGAPHTHAMRHLGAPCVVERFQDTVRVPCRLQPVRRANDGDDP